MRPAITPAEFHTTTSRRRNAHSFGGEYVELVPGELIRYTDKFDDPKLPGVMHVTIKLRPVSFGTEIEQSGIPEKC